MEKNEKGKKRRGKSEEFLPRGRGPGNKKIEINENQPHLHRSSVNQKSIQVLGSLGSRLGLAEDDIRNPQASAILVVIKHRPLDRACRFGEVFL